MQANFFLCPRSYRAWERSYEMSYGLQPPNPWGAWVREWRRMKFQTRKRYNARNSDVSLPARPPSPPRVRGWRRMTKETLAKQPICKT